MSAPGVIHLGLGAFHRAHQALVFDALRRSHGGQWSVLAFSMREPRVAEQLAGNRFRYHVRMGDAQATRWLACHGITQTAVLARDPLHLVRSMATPQARWVTLTVTEKGYTNALAALLMAGLRERWRAGLGGLTLASCDNLHNNGRHLRKLCERACEGEPVLWQWIQANCTFPNSMVDRIVPATTPELVEDCRRAVGIADPVAVATETFWEWVLEDRLAHPGDADVLRAAGVQVVDDVAPFEVAKLNLLNGSHSALACLGALLGIDTVDQVVAQNDLRDWIEALMLEDLGPGLQRQDWPTYAQALLRRFANPTLGHRTHQICNDLSQKIPQRWQAPILRARAMGRIPQHLALAAALAMRYWQGKRESGVAYSMQDPQASEVHRLALLHAGDVDATVESLGRLPSLWGEDLTRDRAWLEAVKCSLQSIRDKGVRASLNQLNQLSKVA